MIRVVLPVPLRALAHVDGELVLELAGPVTQRAVLDAIEARYPMLRGTIRDQLTQRRRPFVRFFACERDLSHEPDTVYVVPIKSDSEHYPPEAKLRVYRSRKGGHEWEPLTSGLPQQDCYVNVLRDAMDVDSLEPCGVYFGTTGGQVYGSADGGDSWSAIVRDLPSVVSVEVQTLA